MCAEWLSRMMRMVQPAGEYSQRLEVVERVVARDKCVPRVEVAPQILGVEVLEEVLHELDVIGIGTVRLDVDDDLVVLGPPKALGVVIASDTEDLLARQAGRLRS